MIKQLVSRLQSSAVSAMRRSAQPILSFGQTGLMTERCRRVIQCRMNERASCRITFRNTGVIARPSDGIDYTIEGYFLTPRIIHLQSRPSRRERVT